MNSVFRYYVIGFVLLAMGCVKSKKLTDPLGVWTCTGYETVKYPREDSAKVWNGKSWEWMQSFRVVDSTRDITNQSITIEAGPSDNTILITNLITQSDSTIGGPPSWNNIQTISLNYYKTDSANSEKEYRMQLAGVNKGGGVNVTLYYHYDANVISLIYSTNIAGQFGSSLGSSIYLGGKKGK